MVGKALIIAPLRVAVSTWPGEIEKWKEFQDLPYVVLHGPKKDSLLQSPAKIHIINPEGLDWLLGVTNRGGIYGPSKSKFKDLGYDILVIDELSKFKRTRSQRHNNLKAVMDHFLYRWGLTGSPNPNGLEDLFGQCFIIDGGATFGRYITKFRHEFFTRDFNGFGYRIAGAEAEKQIYKRLSKIALAMRAEDYLEMPQRIENDIMIDMPEKAKETYKIFERELVAELEDGKVSAKNAISKTMKCRQLASGAVYIDDEVKALIKLPSKTREWVEIHDGKIDALDSLVRELQGSPLLVAYTFEHDLVRIQAHFGKGTPYIGGGVSAKMSNAILKDWNQGKIPLLLGHPASIGHGLNMQGACNHVCFFSMLYDFDQYDQFIRRVLRQGNTNQRVFVHHLLTRGTIDLDILYALKQKKNGQDALFTALSNLRGK